MEPNSEQIIKLDKAAIGVSLLCVVHCLSIPFLMVLGPALNLWFWGSEGFHLVLLVAVVPLSLIAFAYGYRTHRNAKLLMPGLVGLTIVVTSAILEMVWIGPATAAGITTSGGLLLIVTHLMNLKAQRNCCRV